MADPASTGAGAGGHGVTHIFSCGGGVQSTACLVLAAQDKIPYRTFIFANVGDKAESPLTIAYIRDHLRPYAEAHGITWVDVAKIDGVERADLYDELYREGVSGSRIPVHLPNAGPTNRDCTSNWKIRPIAKWIKANAPGCVLGKGISTDEPHRATPSRESDCYTSAYPLIELGISRADCLRIATDAGLPQPPKSSCWFCPYKTTDQWVRLRQEHPDLFSRAVDLERHLQVKREIKGKDPCYLSGIGARRGRTLDQVIPNQLGLFPEWIDEQDGCESGYCMT